MIVLVAVLLHLVLLLVQSSILGDVVLPRFLYAKNVFHVILIALPLFALIIPGLWRSRGKYWTVAGSLALLYASIVIGSSANTCSDVASWTQVFLVPGTIISLTLCAPILMGQKSYRFIFWILALVLALHSLATFCFMLNGTESIWGRSLIDGPGRAKDLFGVRLHHTDGLFSNANAIGSFLMCFPAILLAELALIRSGPALFAIVPVLGSIIGALALTFSRGAQLSVLVGLLFPALYLKKYSKKLSLTLSTGLLVVAVFVLAPPVPLAANSSSMEKEQVVVKRDPLSGRSDIWKQVLIQEEDRPVLGVGLLNKTYDGMSPHNFVLANYVYFGVFGLAALLAMLLTLAIKAVQQVKARPKELLPIVGILAGTVFVHGQMEYVVSFPLYFSNSMFWLLLGYVCFVDFESEDDGTFLAADAASSAIASMPVTSV